MRKLHRVSEIPSEGFFPKTERLSIKNILNQTVIFHNIEDMESETGWFIVMLVELKKKKYSVSCGGQIVMRRLKYAKANRLLPLKGTIIKAKDKRYYDLV